MGDIISKQPAAVATVPPTGKLRTAAGKMLGAARAGMGRAVQLGGDAAQAGGALALRMHRRLYLAILSLVGLLILGAVFRHIGWLQANSP